MSHFDPSTTISAEFGIFGVPTEEANSKLVLLPVPWEVTTSYGRGASQGPRIIRQASEQIDLFDIELGNSWQAGYFMKEIPKNWLELNKKMKAKAQEVIRMKTQMDPNLELQSRLQSEVNEACEKMSQWVYQESKAILNQGKMLGLIGGDHSTPFGAIKAVVEQNQGQVGILHIDAHADLRCAYQGFEQSHASIMHNVMTQIRPQKLVQVGIRDFCEEEFDFIQHHPKTIKTFFDLQNKKRLLKGEAWHTIAQEIVSELPQKVYISFDIDGLDPALCPHTGTPVAGGLSLDQVFYLFSLLAESGKQIVGFDLNEVSSGDEEEAEWDGNVGARVLYKLCGWSVKTNEPQLKS
ncbi:MAG: agmatinase family protein [Pseudobdellovibrionaceae bacterium]